MATVVTNAGATIVVNRLKGTGTEPAYIHWGTGAGVAAKADTTLFTASAEARVLGTSSIVTTTTTNDTYQLVGTITSASAQTITNAGNFDASTAGNLDIHGDFAGIALAIGDAITFTIKHQMT